MAVTFPRTDLFDVGFSDQTFKLLSRQELSRTAYGRTIGKSLGSAIWMATFTTQPLPNDDAVEYESKLNSLDGVTSPLEAYDLRRPYPRAHPEGDCNDGVLSSVAANNKTITLGGLAGSQIVSAGDYLSFTYGDARALHQAVETSGATFEVRPHLRPGWTLGTAVKLKQPRGLFSLMLDSVSSRPNGGIHSVISFNLVQWI